MDEKKGSNKFALFIFIFGLILVVIGGLMEAGIINIGGTEEENTPNKEATSEETETNVDNAVIAVQDGVEFDVTLDTIYTYGDGLYTINVVTLNSTCDENGICGLENDTVVLDFVSADGDTKPITFTPASLTQTVGTVTATVSGWSDGSVKMKIVGNGEQAAQTVNTTDTTANNTAAQ